MLELHRALYRIHRADHDPIFFGRTGDNRFDDPHRAYGVLYAGESDACAFIEAFGEPLDLPFVTEADVSARKLSQVDLLSRVRVVDLTGAGLRRLGADARLFAADHAVAQLWSRALHDHPAQPDGIRYPARHDPKQVAVALFERARPRVRARISKDTLGHASNRALLARLLDRYGLGLL